MIFLKNYNSFKESIQIDIGLIEIDINESLGMFYDNILQSIGAEEVNFFNTFHLPQENFADKTNLDLLTTNPEFIHSLSSIGLKKSNLTNSEDFETFLNKPCKFLLVYKIESNELENPVYILFQSWNETLSKWDGFKMFKINGDIKNFYDKLSSKVIEVEDNGDNYIYSTTNGNEWILQNVDKENDIYQKYFRKGDFEKLLNDRKVKINII
jgi:hypothetical protein